MEKTDKARASLFLLAMVLLYLIIQFHEAFHWIAALCLGASVKYVECQSMRAVADASWKSTAISSAGSLFMIGIIIAGLIMFRSRNEILRKLGFLIVFMYGFGRIGYELNPYLTGNGIDEVSVAEGLGVDSMLLRVPVMAFCLASALYVTLKDRKSGPGRTGWIVPACMMPAALALIAAFSAMLKILMKAGGPFFKPVLLGYLPFLVCVTLVQCALFVLLVHPRLSKRAAVLLAAGIFNLALAGCAVAVDVSYDPRAYAPKVTTITPAGSGIEDVNGNGNSVVIEFDRAMDPDDQSTRKSISYDDNKGILDIKMAWSSTDTLVCTLSREMFPGETFRLEFDRLRDMEGDEIREPILLEFK
jgi:hypothetical protein